MVSRTRRSLRDFDDAALRAPDPPAETPVAAPQPELAPARRAPKTRRPARTTEEPAATARVGVYLHADEFDDAKSAYLADLDADPGAPDSFARWVAAAIDTHAGRTPPQRAALARAEVERPRGFTRSFPVPTDSLDRLRTALLADRHAGRATSRSAFIADAVASAVATTRARTGGTLPPAPVRLPNKPVR